MKNLSLLLAFIIAVTGFAGAQTDLTVKKGSKGLYLDHTVAPKEGLYSIGRIYNVNPKFIAAFNEIDINKGLSIGQVVHIPLTDTNFTQKSKKGTPVYYTVGESENLVKVSNANNKVLLKDLRNWNSLTNDNPAAGTKLIVGFLVAAQPLPIAVNPPAKPATTAGEEKAIVKTGKPDEKAVAKAEPPADKAVVKEKPAEEKAEVKEKPTEEKAMAKAEPQQEKAIGPEIKEQPKTEAVFAKQDMASVSPDQGYFKKSYEMQVKTSPAIKNSTVTSGIFKTTSGWQDGKYYLLIDGVATGTIVKLINPDNNKAIYAKVLGQMNGIRQNEGLDTRISNAAAATLGITDTDKFILKVNY